MIKLTEHDKLEIQALKNYRKAMKKYNYRPLTVKEFCAMMRGDKNV